MTTIKNNIMKRVRIIYLIRTAGLPLIVFFVGLGIIVSTVSVANVIQNSPSVLNFPSLLSFFISALGHTEFIVQAAVTLSALFGVYTIYSLAKVLKRSFSLVS